MICYVTLFIASCILSHQKYPLPVYCTCDVCQDLTLMRTDIKLTADV